MKDRKWFAWMLALVLALSGAAVAEGAVVPEAAAPTEVVAQVTAIEGNVLTLAVGTLTEGEEADAPQKDDAAAPDESAPAGDTVIDSASRGGKSAPGGKNAPDGKNAPGGKGFGRRSDALPFEAGDEVMTLEVTDSLYIAVQNDSGAAAKGSISDISVGSIVRIAYGDDGAAESLTVIGGMRSGSAPQKTA